MDRWLVGPPGAIQIAQRPHGQVMDFMTQFAEQGWPLSGPQTWAARPYWVPKSAGTAMKDEAA